MKKLILFGRSECGKTTLTQTLRGQEISYHKTQYINNFDVIIDTPGEYAENRSLASALAIYSYEADVVGLLLSAIEPYSIYPPNIRPLVNREVIGIVTQIDRPNANPDRAEEWLKLAGCKTIFRISSYTKKGVWKILDYLREDGDVLPWDNEDDFIAQFTAQ
ncbi:MULTISPECIES: EutP/PduV family microcompartment system protein [Clostridium]|jgi:ethanolamine utilization protein EutP|uniref:Propanediol utilization protein PduV n=3 Tax=Clostridium TaxID=1485 RepID=D8GHZ3_CLOLD|nr:MULTISPECIES: EutP/PduV family microcompartment system protein [Clostridium]ADK14855.1 propanediol utilization protein pduV related protein [Clostridium ljungdahlii DSM 13528]AGY78101.1 EutP/PduV family microcompartment system protein [Clostridium autoethanogenum DSM 10061]ALU38235.1 Ethanolamine utilization protein EutP [Clostridium autoethanogenum DSM 10061]OAA87851.1 Propanediol utilization protein PduV [Clostridium ljungdahlii DSM 13528]OVY50998.1 Propanediol utilization protein PduV [C